MSHPEQAVKSKAGKRRPAGATQNQETGAATSLAAPSLLTGRSALIKVRHELMKREIDQIREDLEAEDNED